MDEENKENVNSQNDTEATENATEETVESTESDVEVDLESEVKKATAPLYARMKKAEEEAKELKAKLSKTNTNETSSRDLSTKDLYALIDAKVPEDDIEEVREYAQLKKISVSEALKSNVVKTILKDKAEQRNVANASNTTASKRGSGKVSDEIILESARQGKTTDPEALAKARFAEKLKRIQ